VESAPAPAASRGESERYLVEMIRLGVVPFLNVKPLVYPLERGLVPHGFELVYAPPSELARLMEEGAVDVGLLPVAELIRGAASYSVLPGFSISSHEDVESVVLASWVPLDDVRSVALDGRSRSSAALLRVVLELFRGLRPRYVEREPGDGFFDGVDAGMLIGDEGLRLSCDGAPPGRLLYDVGRLWTEATGLPFVYAVYAVREGTVLEATDLEALLRSRRLGLSMVAKIAAAEASSLGVSAADCRRYLAERIHYGLGEAEMESIGRFARCMERLGLAPGRFELRLYGG